MKKQSLGKSLRDLTESEYREVNPNLLNATTTTSKGRVGCGNKNVSNVKVLLTVAKRA